MRPIAVLQREPWIVVHAELGIYGNTWFASEPFVRLPIEATDADLAGAVRAAFAGSNNRDDLRPELDASGLDRPLMKLFGARSRRDFHRGMRSVTVREEEDGRAVLWPLRNPGSREGFDYLEERTLSAGTWDEPSLIAAIREALQLADPGPEWFGPTGLIPREDRNGPLRAWPAARSRGRSRGHAAWSRK